MEKILLCCVLLLTGESVYSQLLSTVNNVRLVEPIPYMLEVMETTMKDMEDYGWCNLKIPAFEADLNEDVFGWHVQGKANFSNAFVTTIQKLDVIQHTVQQVWRFDDTDNTTSVFVRATLRMLDVALGYDVHVDLEDGTHHFTGIFKHNSVEFPFEVSFSLRDIADFFLGAYSGYGQYNPDYPQYGHNPGPGLYPSGPGYPGQYPGSGYPGSGYPGSGYPGSGYPGHKPGLAGPPGAHPGCPLCDSSVYSYCSYKEAHDACCCETNAYASYNCRKADCKYLYANSCQEYNLISSCCCVDVKSAVPAVAVPVVG